MSDPCTPLSFPFAASPAGTSSPEAAIPELLSAGLNSIGVGRSMQAIGRWWQTHWPAERIIMVVQDVLHHGQIVTEAGTSLPLRTTWVEDCRLSADRSLRDFLCERYATGDDVQWFPFGDRGQLFGGLLLVQGAGQPRGTPPSLWLDVTARLLSHARGLEQRLLHEKLESMAEFAAGAGHEINNPLGSILGRVQLLAKDESHPERRRMLATIGAQALRVRDMIGDAMLFARPPAPQPTSQDLATVVQEVAARFADDAQPRSLRINTNCAADVLLRADGVQLRVVVSELLRNAIHAAPDDSVIDIRASRMTTSGGEVGQLEIADQGPGLTDVEQRHLFDPFFSGRQAGRGLGFGLSKCWRIITLHGGCLHAVNQRPGLHVTVHWPLSGDE